MKLYYLDHSGFMLETAERNYVFDYYRDPAGVVKQAAQAGKELWFFVTHAHGDHYVPEILNFNAPSTRYIVHTDVPHSQMPADRTTVMAVGDEAKLADVPVKMYGSTDAGGSFWLKIGDARIFHAGDLNWWHWLGDTEENNREAKGFMETEFARAAGMDVDVLMFPIDNRLEAAQEWGIIEFLKVVKMPKLLVAMHLNGPAWTPSAKFQSLYETLPNWVPTQNGDSIDLGTYGVAE